MRLFTLRESLYNTGFVKHRDPGDIDCDTPSSTYLVELHLKHQMEDIPGVTFCKVLGGGDQVRVYKYAGVSWAEIASQVKAAIEAVLEM